MNTLSPSYNTITIVVKTIQYDSMDSRTEYQRHTIDHPLNVLALFPITGVFSAACRSLAAIVDIVSNLFRSVVYGDKWGVQGGGGVKNLARAFIEIIPTAIFVANGGSTASFLVSMAMGLLIYARDHFGLSSLESEAPVAAFFDGDLKIQLYPKHSLCMKASEWLSELYKYGQQMAHPD